MHVRTETIDTNFPTFAGTAEAGRRRTSQSLATAKPSDSVGALFKPEGVLLSPSQNSHRFLYVGSLLLSRHHLARYMHRSQPCPSLGSPEMGLVTTEQTTPCLLAAGRSSRAATVPPPPEDFLNMSLTASVHTNRRVPSFLEYSERVQRPWAKAY